MPLISTVIAKSSTEQNRTKLFVFSTSLFMFSMSLGPLVVALIFKFVKDEWDIQLCKSVILMGFVFMNTALFALLGISEHAYEKKITTNEDKKLIESVGGGFFNKVLYSIFVHKIIGTVSMMGIRY